MALIGTLLLGGVVWAWGLGVGGNRAARGRGGWFVWLVLWASVAALVAAWARRRALAMAGVVDGGPTGADEASGASEPSGAGVPEAGPTVAASRPAATAQQALRAVADGAPATAPAPRFDAGRIARTLRDTLVVGVLAATALLLGIPLTGAGDVGLGEGTALLLALALVPPALALIVAAPWLRALALVPLPGAARAVPTGALVRALAPMLLPALVLFTLLHAPLAPEWHGRIAGNDLAGLVWLQLETLAWPAALMVAWALDIVDGSRSRRWHRTVAALAAAALILCAIVPPRLDDPGVYAMAPALVDGAQAPAPSLGPALRATALMLIACAELSSQWLLKVRRWGVGPTRGVLAALFLVPLPMVALAAVIGPQAVPLAAVLGAGVAWALARPMGRGPGPPRSRGSD